MLSGQREIRGGFQAAGRHWRRRAPRTSINLLQAPPAAEPRQILLQVKFAAIDRVALSQIGFNLFSTNDKLLGALTTQQFTPPRFSQLQVQDGQSPSTTVNFSDLLNLFAFRPDINFGATIKALQERNLLQILAEPNLITLEGQGRELPGGRVVPVPDDHDDSDRRRHRPGDHGAVQAIRREAGFHSDGDRRRARSI